MKNFGASQAEGKKSSDRPESLVGSTEEGCAVEILSEFSGGVASYGLDSEVMGDIELLNIASREFSWVLGKNGGWRIRLSSSARSVLVGAGGPSISMSCIARDARHCESSSVDRRNRGIVRIVQVPVEELGGQGDQSASYVVGHCVCQRPISNPTIAIHH